MKKYSNSIRILKIGMRITTPIIALGLLYITKDGYSANYWNMGTQCMMATDEKPKAAETLQPAANQPSNVQSGSSSSSSKTHREIKAESDDEYLDFSANDEEPSLALSTEVTDEIQASIEAIALAGSIVVKTPYEALSHLSQNPAKFAQLSSKAQAAYSAYGTSEAYRNDRQVLEDSLRQAANADGALTRYTTAQAYVSRKTVFSALSAEAKQAHNLYLESHQYKEDERVFYGLNQQIYSLSVNQRFIQPTEIREVRLRPSIKMRPQGWEGIYEKIKGYFVSPKVIDAKKVVTIDKNAKMDAPGQPIVAPRAPELETDKLPNYSSREQAFYMSEHLKAFRATIKPDRHGIKVSNIILVDDSEQPLVNGAKEIVLDSKSNPVKVKIGSEIVLMSYNDTSQCLLVNDKPLITNLGTAQNLWQWDESKLPNLIGDIRAQTGKALWFENNKDKLGAMSQKLEANNTINLTYAEKRSTSTALEEIRLSLASTYARTPALTECNMQDDRYFEQQQQALKASFALLEKRERDTQSLSIAMKVMAEAEEKINTSIIPNIKEIEEAAIEVKVSLEKAQVDIVTAWEKYMTKTAKTTLWSVGLLTGVFACYKTGLLQPGLSLLKEGVKLLLSVFRGMGSSPISENVPLSSVENVIKTIAKDIPILNLTTGEKLVTVIGAAKLSTVLYSTVKNIGKLAMRLVLKR